LTVFETLLEEVGKRGHNVKWLPFVSSTARVVYSEGRCSEGLGLAVVDDKDVVRRMIKEGERG